MSITSEYDEIALRVKATEDISMISDTMKSLFKKGYNMGYADGFSAKCKSIEAKRKTEEREFKRQLDVIFDVMMGPFDIDYQ